MRKLLDATSCVPADSTLPDVLRRIVASACELTDARHGAIGVLDPEGELSDLVTMGADRELIGKLPAGQGILGLLIHDPRPLRLADLRSHPGSSGFPPWHPPMRSFLGVPIRARKTVLGSFYVADKRHAAEFTPHDEELLAVLAAAACAAIGNAILFKEMRLREDWLEAAHQVTSALLDGGAPNTTFRLIAERARVVAGASLAVIARPMASHRSTLMFEVVDAADPREHDRMAGMTVPADESTIGLAFTGGRSVAIRHYGDKVVAQQAGSTLRLPAMVKDLDSAVAVPLIVGTETLGVLVVARFREADPFTDSEARLIQTFAGHAALALEFARVDEDRQRLAVFEDRDRIARDLHDLVIQRLFATGLGLEGLSKLIAKAEIADRVIGFVRDIDRAIHDVRNSIFSLQEPAESHGSLRSELLRLAIESSDALGFEPRIGFEGPLDTLVPDTVRADLIATVREALSNVSRHSAATTVSVEVVVDPRGRQLTLTVTDDGVGIPDQPARRSGLANLSERADRWSGTFSVRPGRKLGTILTWSISLPARA
jgi:signal transduction histidine kinase